jgi:hypothetical protein
MGMTIFKEGRFKCCVPETPESRQPLFQGGPMMTSQNRAEQDFKPLAASRDDAVPKDAEPSEIKRELTDEEIATVTAGTMRALNPQPLPP